MNVRLNIYNIKLILQTKKTKFYKRFTWEKCLAICVMIRFPTTLEIRWRWLSIWKTRDWVLKNLGTSEPILLLICFPTLIHFFLLFSNYLTNVLLMLLNSKRPSSWKMKSLPRNIQNLNSNAKSLLKKYIWRILPINYRDKL